MPCFTKQNHHARCHGTYLSYALSCAFRNTIGITKLPPPLLCLLCKLQVINYRQSRIWSRVNYTLEALVKLRLPSSFTYFPNLHPSMVCQNLSPQSNYWLVCGQKSNFETILLQLSNIFLCSSSQCGHCSLVFSHFRMNTLLHPWSDSIYIALASVRGNVQCAF